LDKNNLPYIIDLLDDEEEVRTEILTQLNTYNGNLEEDLAQYSDLISDSKLELIVPILQKSRRIWLKQNWKNWTEIENEYVKLETAIDLINKFQLGFIKNQFSMKCQLDNLANEFKELYPRGNVFDLAFFLFQIKSLKGNTSDYFNPLNSNVILTIENKSGLPITLCIIYMLVGFRLELSIKGCNFPGHFISQVEFENKKYYIDCFNGGKILTPEDLEELLQDSFLDLSTVLEKETTSNAIMHRVVRNLINAYKIKKDEVHSEFFQELLIFSPVI
jgi:regulator of sirC expression with transglutaminase-like and TPR domain